MLAIYVVPLIGGFGRAGDPCVNCAHAFRMRVRQTLQEQRVYQRENRRVRANRESQRKHHRESEATILGELAEAEAAIGHDRMEPMAKLFLAYLLLDLFRAAEFHSRRSLGFLASHARSNPFVNQHLEVRANLPVKVFLYTPGEKEISEKTFGLCKQRHAPPQEHHGASKACAMAQEMRPHRLDSASSCFLPALVRR